MNLIELKEPPKNFGTYVKAPERFGFNLYVGNLRALMKEGTTNIEIEECPFTMIHDLEDVITENRYKVQFVSISGTLAYGHFFLEKPS